MIPYGQQSIDDEDIAEVTKVLRSDWITTGPKVDEFEEAVARYLGCRHTVAVNSGTSALDIAVQALGLPEGSEIITTPLTFAADANCALYNNCKPVFADIERETRNISPADIRRHITKKTKAIIYVDYAGQPCDIEEIREIADEHGLYLIEDACHALGAEYHGKKVGGFADMTILSFHPVKHITTGEGGAVVTNDDGLCQKLKLLRSHGMDRTARERSGKALGYVYDIKMLGRNYRITDIQCALGLSQLRKIDHFLARRQELADLYDETLKDVSFVETPVTRSGIRHAWHLYTILLEKGIDRDVFYEYMRNNGIGANVHYIPVYRFTYYREHFDIDPAAYPVTEDVFSSIITLPLHPGLTDDDVRHICDVIRSFKQTGH
ncbi:MAG TPA: UDP-4-amino-4,6-dideoxy-N-acetyl-beta-L-altrosamine transaminase [Methanocella sp.]|jgi:UDP-4-amino-4,6-dideoxy-N-acetyl-beta-L-altrosamine transaminase